MIIVAGRDDGTIVVTGRDGSERVALCHAGAITLYRGSYDAFGFIGTTFRELDWKTLIFFERAVPISPNAW